jgi:uncharacterized membrane protein (UPF0127 family)
MQTRRVASALLAVALACAGGGPVARIETGTGTVSVALEVADSPEALERGLMYRKELRDGHGMLFVFPDESEHSFWMKNTLIPLDMLFIAGDGRIVGVHPDATPLSTAQITVGKPSRFVLEVPGGFAARHGVASGDRIVLSGVRVP